LPHRAISELDEEAAHRLVVVVPVPNANVGTLVQGVPGVEGAAEDLADERCSRAVLDFLATTDVGTQVLAPAEENALSFFCPHPYAVLPVPTVLAKKVPVSERISSRPIRVGLSSVDPLALDWFFHRLALVIQSTYSG
jgi:hypothetical protein